MFMIGWSSTLGAALYIQLNPTVELPVAVATKSVTASVLDAVLVTTDCWVPE